MSLVVLEVDIAACNRRRLFVEAFFVWNQPSQRNFAIFCLFCNDHALTYIYRAADLPLVFDKSPSLELFLRMYDCVAISFGAVSKQNAHRFRLVLALRIGVRIY